LDPTEGGPEEIGTLENQETDGNALATMVGSYARAMRERKRSGGWMEWEIRPCNVTTGGPDCTVGN